MELRGSGTAEETASESVKQVILQGYFPLPYLEEVAEKRTRDALRKAENFRKLGIRFVFSESLVSVPHSECPIERILRWDRFLLNRLV